MIPPIPLLNTTADDIYLGLHRHAHTKEIEEFEDALFASSQLHFKIRGGDGATSNDRLFNFEAFTEKPDHFRSKQIGFRLLIASAFASLGMTRCSM